MSSNPPLKLHDGPTTQQTFEQLLAELAQLVRNGLAREDLQMIGSRDFAKLLAVSTATFERLKAAGKIPHPIELTAGCHRWPLASVRAWIEAGCPQRKGGSR